MPIFSVERFRVTECSQRIGGVTRETRAIEIEGPAGQGGRPSRASFVFSAVFAASPGPAVGYATCGEGGGAAIVGWFPIDTFATFEAVLKDPRPAQVHYELRDHGSDAGYLRRLGLGSEGEARATNGTPAGVGRPAGQLGITTPH